VEPERVVALIHSLARDCRSLAPGSTFRLVARMSGRSRRSLYEILLTIVERLPTRLPTLHSGERLPERGFYRGGWPRWHRERVLTKEFHEDVMLGRAIRDAARTQQRH
jgi:hypothetical protein